MSYLRGSDKNIIFIYPVNIPSIMANISRLIIFVGILALLLPFATAYLNEDYPNLNREEKDGRIVYYNTHPYNYNNYNVDIRDQLSYVPCDSNYGKQNNGQDNLYNSPSVKVEYQGSDYGYKTYENYDGTKSKTPSHAYYTDDYGGSVRVYYYDSNYNSDYANSAYGTYTRDYSQYNDLTYKEYGSSSNNAGIWTTYTVSNYGNSYSSSANSGTYTRSAYGSSSGSSYSSRSGSYRYVDSNDYSGTRYYAKTIKNNKYETHLIPTGGEYDTYKQGYEYKAKVYKVNKKSYAYDHYPLN